MAPCPGEIDDFDWARGQLAMPVPTDGHSALHSQFRRQLSRERGIQKRVLIEVAVQNIALPQARVPVPCGGGVVAMVLPASDANSKSFQTCPQPRPAPDSLEKL